MNWAVVWIGIRKPEVKIGLIFRQLLVVFKGQKYSKGKHKRFNISKLERKENGVGI